MKRENKNYICFIISKYLHFRDVNEKHLSWDLSCLFREEDRKTAKANTKGTILFFSCPRLLFI